MLQARKDKGAEEEKHILSDNLGAHGHAPEAGPATLTLD